MEVFELSTGKDINLMTRKELIKSYANLMSLFVESSNGKTELLNHLKDKDKKIVEYIGKIDSLEKKLMSLTPHSHEYKLKCECGYEQDYDPYD